MVLAEGILTARGGMTSTQLKLLGAWVNAKVAGCSELRVDENKKIIKAHNGLEIKEGEMVSTTALLEMFILEKSKK